MLILLTGLLLVVGGCKDKPKEEAIHPVTFPVAQVKIVNVVAQTTQSLNEATGTVEAIQRVTIATKVTGTIESLPVEVGSVVKVDDVLVRISAGEINARVAQAEAQLEQVRRNLEREQRLLAKEASTPETVKSMEDGFRVAQAGYNEAKTMLGYTTITAPYDGVIAAKNFQAGDLATPGAPLLVLENNRKLQVVASVPEALAMRIKIGDRLPVRVDAAGFEKTGMVSEIAPSADPQSRTTTVKLQLDDISSLRPGQYVRLIIPGTTVKTLMVPQAAVRQYGQMEQLLVVKDDVAHLRLVRTGERLGDQIEILSGVEAGEQVVIQGNDRLVDGQPIRVVQ